jgi:lipopolysaccharide export system protein LptA
MKMQAIAVLFVGLLYAGMALAEKADRDKPIHIEADQATVEDVKLKDANRVSIFTGNVKFTQGTLIIRAEKVILKEDISGLRNATALGDLVTFRQKRDGLDEYIEGWSRRVEFDNNADKIELFREARLKRGEDEVQGDYISYNTATEFFQVIGSKERGDVTGPDSRVRVVIQPKNKREEPDSDAQ